MPSTYKTSCPSVPAVAVSPVCNEPIAETNPATLLTPVIGNDVSVSFATKVPLPEVNVKGTPVVLVLMLNVLPLT